MKPILSIIIPVLNEQATIVACLQSLNALRRQGVEIIVVDGGSSDATAELAQPLADAVIHAPRGRARQLNAGASWTSAPLLLFLHADTTLPPNADALVCEALRSHGWGRFDVHIQGKPWMLRVVAAMMNWRSRWSGIATGDQAIFMQRDWFERVGGFPDQPLMEDIEISKRLRLFGRPACIHKCVLTSGRRWESRGVWQTIFLMWRLRWRYWRGESATTLASAYR